LWKTVTFSVTTILEGWLEKWERNNTLALAQSFPEGYCRIIDFEF
jgi:hypothetical protein